MRSVTWEDTLEEADGPHFQRLGEEGVIRVAEGFLADIPRLCPWETFLIDEDAHELGDSDGGMRVVELNGGF